MMRNIYGDEMIEILLCTDEMVIKGQKYCYSDRDRVRNTVIVIEKEL